ncbi:MAG: NAD(P)-binding domain-containing protein [Chryseolinea sp.]
MQIGLVGLGEMGFNLTLNLQRNKYVVVAYDVNPAAIKSIQEKGIKTATSLKNLAENLQSKRIIWLMIPEGELVDQTIQELQPYLSVGDIIIDGGNSFYKDSMRRYKEMEAFQIDFLDYGTSGGTDDVRNEIRAMIHGNRFAFNYCEQLFKDICENGYQYCGKIGSGYSAKDSQ